MFMPFPTLAMATVYRCDVGGKTTYQERPCVTGTQKKVDIQRGKYDPSETVDSTAAAPQTSGESTASRNQGAALDLIEFAMQNRIITKFENGLNQVYVDPFFWDQFDIDKREKLGAAAFLFMKQRGDNQWLLVEIRHGMTGKRLAKYSPTLGYRNEE